MDQIKKQLIQNAKTAHYTTQNGTKIISCICSIDQQYMHIESKSNNDQLIQNEKNSFLDKDQDLISKSWDVFQMEPKYKNEFIHYISELQKMARNDNIQVECVVYDSKDNTVYAFPGITDRKLTAYYQLSIRATTII